MRLRSASAEQNFLAADVFNFLLLVSNSNIIIVNMLGFAIGASSRGCASEAIFFLALRVAMVIMSGNCLSALI